MTALTPSTRYLLVTHIPFLRQADGRVMIDGLWARDLEGLVHAVGPIRVAAPALTGDTVLGTWGPTATTLGPDIDITFIDLPPIHSRREIGKWLQTRSVLVHAVQSADLVHSHNLFPPHLGLSVAHDRATRLGKKTIFVIAEDFYDMLEWEWVRNGPTPLARWTRRRQLARVDARVRRSAATASLTLLHTPAAVNRYRLVVRKGIAIRQPGHERDDVIAETRLAAKCAAVEGGVPLVVIAACRHKGIKGLDFLVRAVALLSSQGVRIDARIYGAGEETVSLQRLAGFLGVSDRVVFPGALPPGPEMYQAIAAGHLFAMPHRTTDFGRAFFDAMAGATPVVAFRTAASVDTVRDGVDGLIVPLDDVEGLAAALRRFDRDRALLIRAAHEARTRALTNTRSAWYQYRAEWTRELLTGLIW
jgi:glycosyltransferase involved in cell wall biosynthesis